MTERRTLTPDQFNEVESTDYLQEDQHFLQQEPLWGPLTATADTFGIDVLILSRGLYAIANTVDLKAQMERMRPDERKRWGMMLGTDPGHLLDHYLVKRCGVKKEDRQLFSKAMGTVVSAFYDLPYLYEYIHKFMVTPFYDSNGVYHKTTNSDYVPHQSYAAYAEMRQNEVLIGIQEIFPQQLGNHFQIIANATGKGRSRRYYLLRDARITEQ